MLFEKRNQGFFPRRLVIGILVFVIVSTFATCSEALAGFQQTQYVLTREHRLNKSLLYEQEVESLLDCGHLCLAELCRGCKSINFEKEGTENMNARKKCQLNNETKATKPERFVPDPAFNYYEVINMKESDQTCEAEAIFVANFTNLGASGHLGPTSLGSFYAGQDHANMVKVVNGTQYWTVPFTGTYQITAVGASGGYDTLGPDARGRGAYMKGDFDLNKGEVIKILVGQQGVENVVKFSSGGGGGTFVVTSSNKPVLVAGGGGGIQKLDTRLSNCDASVGTSGKKNQCFKTGCSSWSGGVNGSGALEADNDSSGGGGGGFYSNGRSSILFGGKYGNGGEGGKSFLQGGAGGRAKINNAVGGFGGGGGANGSGGGAGGGGGYSGGASGDNVASSCGGGGGSFNIGRNQENNEGFQGNGHGYVEINRIFPDV